MGFVIIEKKQYCYGDGDADFCDVHIVGKVHDTMEEATKAAWEMAKEKFTIGFDLEAEWEENDDYCEGVPYYFRGDILEGENASPVCFVEWVVEEVPDHA